MLRHQPDFTVRRGATLPVSAAPLLCVCLVLVPSVAFTSSRVYMAVVFALVVSGVMAARISLTRFFLVIGAAVALFVLPVAVISGLVVGPAIAELLLLRAITTTTLVVFMFTLLGTTGLLRALSQLGLPRSLVFVLTIILGQVTVLARCVSEMTFARTARTLDPQPWHRATAAIGTNSAVLLRKSLAQSDELHDAMLARGFDGTIPDFDAAPRWTMRDLAMLIAASALAAWGLFLA